MTGDVGARGQRGFKVHNFFLHVIFLEILKSIKLHSFSCEWKKSWGVFHTFFDFLLGSYF